MSIRYVLILFLSQLAVGMHAAVAILPPAVVDARFFRTINFCSAFFVLGALALRRTSPFQLPEIFGSAGPDSFLVHGGEILFFLFGLFCLISWARLLVSRGKATRVELLLTAATGLAAVALDSLVFRPAIVPSWTQSLLLPVNFISTALILGGFLAGMIFGHYYLVNTEMPKRLLRSMAWILISILVFRILAVGTTLLLYKEVIRPDVDFLSALISFAGHGIFFWERILVGLFIPSIVVAMIWKTSKIGSNQSATGIMYVAIAFVFIGELAARYLFFLSAIPL